jgi:flagellin
MSLTLNTNINSLNAQRNLTSSQSSLTQALQRLSSGLQINSAADDAAGLAISSRFTTQINGTNQAISNANNAISEAQTAGGALSTLTDNLQSIRTLAVQAANGSNSASDRAALDAQVQQQISEITRIASQTSFNGTNVLDGTSGVTTYQVGANVGNTISINLTQGVRADQIGQVATQQGAVVSTNALTATNTVTISDGSTTVTVGATAAGSQIGQTASSAYAKAQALNSSGLQGLSASAVTNATDTAAFSGVGGTAGTAASTYSLSINGTAIFANSSIAAGTTLTSSQVVNQVNLASNQTGVTASVDTTGHISFNAADGRNITVKQDITLGGGAAGTGLSAAVADTTANGGKTTAGQVTLTDVNSLAITGTGTAVADIGFGAFPTIARGTTTLASANVLTVAGANATISAVDSALATVSAFQSQLGAIQNRFTSTVSNLQSTAQNLTQSRSTIQDTNFASETAKLTQSQVLQQAGISVLAQANSQPQLILKLLP